MVNALIILGNPLFVSPSPVPLNTTMNNLTEAFVCTNYVRTVRDILRNIPDEFDGMSTSVCVPLAIP